MFAGEAVVLVGVREAEVRGALAACAARATRTTLVPRGVGSKAVMLSVLDHAPLIRLRVVRFAPEHVMARSDRIRQAIVYRTDRVAADQALPRARVLRREPGRVEVYLAARCTVLRGSDRRHLTQSVLLSEGAQFAFLLRGRLVDNVCLHDDVFLDGDPFVHGFVLGHQGLERRGFALRHQAHHHHVL